MEQPIKFESFTARVMTPEEIAEKDKFLPREEHQEDVYEASMNLANYLKNEKINNVMFLDNSARQAYVGLQEAWKKIGDGEKGPNIYFINPDAIRDDGDFDYYKEEFLNNYKNLNPEEPLLLYDACIHSGAAMFNTKDFLEFLGFKDVRVAVTSPNESFPEEKYDKLDLICLDHRAAKGCQPFGRPGYVKNACGKVISQPAGSADSLKRGQREHKRIREIFNEQYEKNNS